MTRRIAVAFILIAVICAAIYVAFFMAGSRSRSLTAAVQGYGFTAITPPSTLVPPGTIVAVAQENPLVVGIVCPPAESFGSALAARMVTSGSVDAKEVSALSGEFALDPAMQKQLAGHVDSRYLKAVTVTLTNVRIVEVPDTAVFELVSSRIESCTKAMAFRRSKGTKISMIKAVMQASAVYHVAFDSKLDAGARAQVTRGLAGTLGLTNGLKSDDTIQGDGLIWGVRDDASLAAIAANTPPPTGAGTHARALPVDRVATVVRDVPMKQGLLVAARSSRSWAQQRSVPSCRAANRRPTPKRTPIPKMPHPISCHPHHNHTSTWSSGR